MAEIRSDSGELVFFTDIAELSSARQAAFEAMHAEMEAELAAEDDETRTAS